MGSRTSGIDPEIVKEIVRDIKAAKELGVQIAVVVGGGNIYRGINSEKDGIDEETGHYMGILATCINGLALPDLFNSFGLPTKTLSALGKIGHMDEYSAEAGKKILDDGDVLILAGGTGKPFCSTDTAAAQRAKELGLEAIFKVTKVDGIYDADPINDPKAKKLPILSFDEVLERDLRVMDRKSFEICKDNKIEIVVFKLEPGNIEKAVRGEMIGSVVK